MIVLSYQNAAIGYNQVNVAIDAYLSEDGFRDIPSMVIIMRQYTLISSLTFIPNSLCLCLIVCVYVAAANVPARYPQIRCDPKREGHFEGY
jgi:hypothetical protein